MARKPIQKISNPMKRTLSSTFATMLRRKVKFKIPMIDLGPIWKSSGRMSELGSTIILGKK